MFPQLGPMELGVIMIVAVVMFGKRLPEVGRSLGKGIVEFKKGLRGIEEELDTASTVPAHRADSGRSAEPIDATIPKFEPPTMPPVARTDADAPSSPA